MVWALATDAEFLNKIQICLAISFSNVAQQAAALADHLQQSTASHVVMLVSLQMLGNFLDALSQYGDLGAGPAGIVLMYLRAFDSGGLFVTRNHVVSILTDRGLWRNLWVTSRSKDFISDSLFVSKTGVNCP